MFTRARLGLAVALSLAAIPAALATAQGGDATFTYGSIDDRTGVLQDAGDTTGKFFLGKDGVVQIALPGDFATGTLQSPYAQADESVTIPMVGGALSTDDNGPDEMN